MTTRRRPWFMPDIAVAAGSSILIGLWWTALPARFAILGAVAVLIALPGYIAWRTSPSVRTGDGGPDSRPFVSAGPPPRAAFRGRGRELDWLREHYRGLRTPDAANGPIILAVHGMPGVGKSALAVELARSLAVDFPDGQLYANLGSAGRIRAEADILYRFLRSLGVPPSEIPTSTVDRSAYFRSATADKKMLVILDAARDHDQVARLMPAGDACAVIVTSRRDLGGAMGVRSMRLRVPDLDEALEILWSVSNTRFGEDQKFAIELVQRLGRLPLAIRAVGDMMVQQMEGLADVARTLRDPAALERVLRSYGRGVEDRFDSEYGRLTAIEQRALRLLSLIDTPSFVPWILIPLLGHDVRDYAEVEKLISRLSERQLLEPAGVDEVTGLDRYTFHPLVRMFAERRRDEARDDEAGDDLDAARDRVDEAYLEAAERVLAGLDPAYRDSMPTQRPPKWYPVETAISGQIASLPGRWVRSEYANLVRGVQAAQASRQWHVAWRIAARLGDCATHVVDRRQVRDVFEIGLTAAEDDGDPFGTIEVLLAQGGWLSRVGDLGGAYDSLTRAAHLANTSRHRLAPLSAGPLGDHRGTLRKAYRLECEAHRRIAEAQLSIGAYRDAGMEIRRAARLADLAGDQRLKVLLRLMHCHVAHDHPDTIPAGDREDEETLFWRELATAEHELRHRRFGEASERLRKLRHEYEDDTARVATLLMRIAALRLEQINLGSGDAQHLMGRGLHRAAEAVNRFQLVGDVAGEIRARSILLRALVSLEFEKPARNQLETIEAHVAEVDPAVWHERSPLWAAVARAEGELTLATGDTGDGRATLARAAAVFRAHGDHLAEDGIRRAHLFGELPHDAFDDGPPGRQASARVMATAPIEIGQTFTVAYSLGAAALVDGRFPAGGRTLLILLVADGADAEPPSHTARLDSWAPLGPLEFRLTAARSGPLLIRFLVYDADRGTLLQESHLPPFDIAELAHQDVTV